MAEEPLVQKNIRFPQDLWTRLDRAVPKDKSEFIRQAVEEKLRPMEIEARLRTLEERANEG